MNLDLSSLGKAIAQLETSLALCDSDLPQKYPVLVDQLRSANIQAFEYTYELAWKMLKRYLQMTEANSDVVEEMTFQNLIRTGFEKGLTQSSMDVWKKFREARSISSHTYDHEKAVSVFKVVPDFVEEARFLFDTLSVRTKV